MLEATVTSPNKTRSNGLVGFGEMVGGKNGPDLEEVLVQCSVGTDVFQTIKYNSHQTFK